MKNETETAGTLPAATLKNPGRPAFAPGLAALARICAAAATLHETRRAGLDKKSQADARKEWRDACKAARALAGA